MKYWYVMLLAVCLGCFSAFGEKISDDEIDRLKGTVKIGGVSDSTEDGEEDEELEVLSFYTNQYEDDAEEYEFRIKVVVEITDKKAKKVYQAKMARMQGAVDTEYTGEDNWAFKIPYGEMEKPKITAYVIQYGVLSDREFVILAEEMDDVDSLEELEARAPTMVERNPVLFHQYNYRDTASEDEEVIQSSWN
ncbi:hypothetical protein [Tichowtungia aerotolerans]|uniref:Uncharacterized protein n=1 Tax=Tichowtungia aerotolerans TaxID=2697043 RepID=A0A6P1M4X7_9BACT|nr:hypothetical protein [Tichowtungia aerotolerans]QHI68053.1 hypothetical protein GT409_00825 [Tichowtungia aerotolerans]